MLVCPQNMYHKMQEAYLVLWMVGEGTLGLVYLNGVM